MTTFTKMNDLSVLFSIFEANVNISLNTKKIIFNSSICQQDVKHKGNQNRRLNCIQIDFELTRHRSPTQHELLTLFGMNNMIFAYS